eukprot:CAMPEP_0206143802 /NCGR_PEP_ID=MMETSP1473-20131121/21850_1 /ASSEMBLY_ACC=CAM_ASM_001109 /TAXON_ID=1461547 /ORGANISM="Stichococcus sp, Strain RCC1054" /LENGTH=483 /DNA_ID=CAMNT_0053539373 /DNA_START=173 /DNA_END=1621 /DNA_ORIENTATION=+
MFSGSARMLYAGSGTACHRAVLGRLCLPPPPRSFSTSGPPGGRHVCASGSDDDNHVSHRVDEPASRTNGDPGATSSSTTSSGSAAESSAAVPTAGGSTAEEQIAALRSDLQKLQKALNTQTAAAQQQFLSINSLERQAQGRSAPQPRTHLPQGTTGSGSRGWSPGISPFEAQRTAIGDRRYLGGFDARFHSTNSGATPDDYRVLPRKIILVRHAESEGNVDNYAYTYVPDMQVPLTERGKQQAARAGDRIREVMDADQAPYSLFFYTSPYKRSKQTYEEITKAFDPKRLVGSQEEVQLREQDFGNFQDMEGKEREKTERLRFGRFFYRFPNGESGADVYDRMTIFEDHLVRDINAGRYSKNTSLVLVTHGLALRIFLMRWFHWTVDQFLEVYNPPNAEPLVLERVPHETEARTGGPASWIHTKALYMLADSSKSILRGCTDDMCVTSCRPWDGKAEPDACTVAFAALFAVSVAVSAAAQVPVW